MNSQNPNNEFRATALFTGSSNYETREEQKIVNHLFAESFFNKVWKSIKKLIYESIKLSKKP